MIIITAWSLCIEVSLIKKAAGLAVKTYSCELLVYKCYSQNKDRLTKEVTQVEDMCEQTVALYKVCLYASIVFA